MSFKKGKLMRVAVDGVEIFHEVSIEMTGGTDFKGVSTKDTDGEESAPGSKNWGCNCDAIASDDVSTKHDFKAMVDFWNAQTLVQITVSDKVTGSIEMTGDAYVADWKMGATVDESVNYSFSLKGNGGLTVGVVAVI